MADEKIKTVVVPAAPAAEAPAPPGIFTELAKLEHAQDRVGAAASDERHSFGAWCRALGISAADLQRRIGDKTAHVPSGMTGDGPVMSETEFKDAVGFELQNTFGQPAAVRVHVAAEDARSGIRSGELEDAAAGRNPRKV